jgi:hypothetical protein
VQSSDHLVQMNFCGSKKKEECKGTGKEMENVSRGPTYGDFVTIVTERGPCRTLWLQAGLRIWIQIKSGFNRVSGSGSGFGIRIRIQEGKNDAQK